MRNYSRKFHLLMLSSLLIATSVCAESQDPNVTSFGKRAPTFEELSKAFAPAPKSSTLMSMGLPKAVKKSIDMELLFPFASATISPKVKTQLGALGEFLQSAQLGPGEFLIEGHSDGVGSAENNRQLSERRAQAVKGFLVSQYKVSPQVISVSGVGSQHLKDPANPASEANRRVEFSMIVKE
ncbi:MAG: OmpA family protein [Polaromonas sp.]|nr:OmpA family protein [Polaromonas sp.]